MKRAAEEKPRTLSAWRQHRDRHGPDVRCVCDEQPGRFRKTHRFGCGRPRCYVCHGGKLNGEPTSAGLRDADAHRLGLAELTDK